MFSYDQAFIFKKIFFKYLSSKSSALENLKTQLCLKESFTLLQLLFFLD